MDWWRGERRVGGRTDGRHVIISVLWKQIQIDVSLDVAGWIEEFACGFPRIAGRFMRREPRLQARSFLLGVLCEVDTGSCCGFNY